MFSFFLDITLGMELLGCIITPCLTSGGSIFLKQAHHCTILRLFICEGYNFSNFLQTLILSYLAILVISHCGFDFPNDY